MLTILDRVMPTWDFGNRHAVTVHATAGVTYTAIRHLDLAAAPIARLLFVLRGLGLPRRRAALRLDDALRLGFVLVGEEPGREIVVAAAGRFWQPRGGRLPVDAAEVATWAMPGTAVATMAFRVDTLPSGRSRIVTETRVRCVDAGARRAFGRYWWAVRLGSALIRRAALARAKRDAESTM